MTLNFFKRLLLSTTLFLAFLQVEAQSILPEIPAKKHRFIVIAHRGDHVYYPENTLAAYAEGIKHEVDYVEIDLRTTKDSMLVIMHDETVDRMTNGKGKVSDLSFAEIRKLKIKGKGPDSIHSYQVPSFEEVLSLCKDKIYIYLDFKNASVEKSWAMIQKFGMDKQFLVYINAPSQYRDWRRVSPSTPLMVSLFGNIKTKEQILGFLKRVPVSLLDGDYSDYSPELVQIATERGVTVWPDIQSVGEAQNWNKAIELGFKGLQTDHPADLIAYLIAKGLR